MQKSRTVTRSDTYFTVQSNSAKIIHRFTVRLKGGGRTIAPPWIRDWVRVSAIFQRFPLVSVIQQQKWGLCPGGLSRGLASNRSVVTPLDHNPLLFFLRGSAMVRTPSGVRVSESFQKIFLSGSVLRQQKGVTTYIYIYIEVSFIFTTGL